VHNWERRGFPPAAGGKEVSAVRKKVYSPASHEKLVFSPSGELWFPLVEIRRPRRGQEIWFATCKESSRVQSSREEVKTVRARQWAEKIGPRKAKEQNEVFFASREAKKSARLMVMTNCVLE